MPFILLAFIAGILGGAHLRLPPSYLIAGILGSNIVLLISLLGGRRRLGLVAAPFIFALIGLFYIGRVLYPDLPPSHIRHLAGDQKYRLEGVLDRPPEPLPDRTRLTVRMERAVPEEGSFPVVGNLLLTVRDPKSNLRYGDRVRFISRVYSPRPATNPGAFDYRKFLAWQGVWATAYINNFDEIVRMEEGQGNPFFQFVEQWREKIRMFLDQHAPADSRGIIKALVLGERGDISKEINEKFIVSGVSHILSISGLHVALVAAFFFALTRFIMKMFPFLLLRFHLNKTSALAAILPVIFYTFIAGLGLAAVRSMIMVLSFLWVLLLDREKDIYDALFFAAFVILVVSPAALFDISFQLSFLSVLAIIYLLPRFQEYLALLKKEPLIPAVEGASRWKGKILGYVEISFLTSLAAILGTGPLVVYYFNRISIVGFLSNLILVPLMGLGNTLLSLLAALFIFIFEPLAEILTGLNASLIRMATFLVDLFSRFPMASWRVTTPTIAEVLLTYGLIIMAANLRRWRRAYWGVIIFAGLLGAGQIYEIYTVHSSRELKVTFLDVGQADAAVIQFPGGKTMVVDGGGTADGNFDPGERIVGPYLWKSKRKKIDMMVSTHSHPDHLQGLIFLLGNFAVEEVWNNGIVGADSTWGEKFLESAGERLRAMGREERPREINGVRIEFLHPSHGPESEIFVKENDDSLVLRIVYGEVSFLLPGDIEAAAEEDILKTGLSLSGTVIKAPHHGSKSSSTPRFLEKVHPQYVVFTARGGRSHLPNPAVLERYESMGAKVYRSDRDGAITFITDGKNMRVETFTPISGQNTPYRPK